MLRIPQRQRPPPKGWRRPPVRLLPMRYAVFVALCCSTCVAACDSEAPAPPGEVVERVQMVEGMRWTYAYREARYGPRVGETAPDSLEAVSLDTVVVTVAGLNVDLGAEEGLIELRGVSVESGPFVMWYRDVGDALEWVAEDDFADGVAEPWVVPFAPEHPGGASAAHRGGGDCGTSAAGDAYCLSPYPYRAYQYPFDEGRNWTVFSVPNLSVLHREVTGNSELTTPAGTFQVAAIANRWDHVPLVGTEYVAREGLVRRETRSEARRFSETGELDGVRVFARQTELIRLERP